MSLRREFVELARQPDANIRALCRRFDISPKTGYKWLNRYTQEDASANALCDRSPHAVRLRSRPQS